MGIFGKFRNCGIISNLLICEFLKICWNIFGNFSVENKLYWIVEIVEIVGIIGEFWNFGLIVIPIISIIHMNKRN